MNVFGTAASENDSFEDYETSEVYEREISDYYVFASVNYEQHDIGMAYMLLHLNLKDLKS